MIKTAIVPKNVQYGNAYRQLEENGLPLNVVAVIAGKNLDEVKRLIEESKQHNK